MVKRFPNGRIVFFSAILFAIVMGCYGNNRNPIAKSWDRVASSGGSASQESTTSYEKYGGSAAVQKIVDATWFLLLSDPELEPTFSLVGKTRGDSVDHVKSCLDLQISVLLDGPGEVPGTSYSRRAPARGYQCDELSQSFSELGVTSEEFDRFTWHLVSVLKSHGFTEKDISNVTKSLLSAPPAMLTSL